MLCFRIVNGIKNRNMKNSLGAMWNASHLAVRLCAFVIGNEFPCRQPHIPSDRCEALASLKGCFLTFLFQSPSIYPLNDFLKIQTIL